MVSVPKKKYKGICEVDNFRGIAVVSVVYKQMCSMVQGRLVQMVEGEHCWLKSKVGSNTLTLLRQMKMMRRKRGMFAAFIDFRKAYDSVDINSCGDAWKIWVCRGGWWSS